MKIKGLRDGADGWVNIILSSVLYLLTTINIITGISYGDGFLYYLAYVIPYLTLGLSITIFGWGKSLPYVLLVVGVITTWNTSMPYDLSGFIFFCLAIYMKKNNAFNIFVLNATIISIVLRSVKINMYPPRVVVLVLGYFVLYALFYFIVYRPCIKPLRDKEKLLKNFTDQEKELIKLLRSGETQKTAGHIMSLPPNGANDMLKKLKKESGCKTTIEFFSSL
ncbi:MAG: hypothetical protein GY793_09920 [Proteobacteria bacterium]|nr:hypothetical protein [Pseudomonadota bacterium]